MCMTYADANPALGNSYLNGKMYAYKNKLHLSAVRYGDSARDIDSCNYFRDFTSMVNQPALQTVCSGAKRIL